MSFWGEGKWASANAAQTLIDAYDPAKLKDGCYRLSMGDEAIVSSGDLGRHGGYRKLGESDILTLEPGRFAFLITKEAIHLPANAIGLINVETNIKFKGLVNISGFHVDPLYSGKLIFTVFNAGPSFIDLCPNDPIFRLWLSDFDPPSTNLPASGYKSLPRDWAERLQGVYPSPFALVDQVRQLEANVRKLEGQRKQFALGLFILGVLLAPFIAGLYVEVFSPIFHGLIKSVVHE